MSKVIDYVLNFESQLTTPSQKKRFAKIAAYFKEAPLALGEKCELNKRAVAGTGYYVSLGSLLQAIDSAEAGQFDVQPNRVLNIGDGKPEGVIYNRVIYEDVEVSYTLLDDEGNPLDKDLFELSGGRHRTVFRALAYFLSGYDISSEEVQNVLIKAECDEYSVNKILTSNGSRQATTPEKQKALFSSSGIEPDVMSIVDAILTAQMKRLAGWQYAFTALAEQAQQRGEDIGITVATAAKIGGTVQKIITSVRIKNRAFAFPKQDYDYADLIEKCFSFLPEAVVEAKNNGTTTIARDGSGYVAQLICNRYGEYMKNRPSEPKTIAPVASLEHATDEKVSMDTVAETMFALEQLTKPPKTTTTTTGVRRKSKKVVPV